MDTRDRAMNDNAATPQPGHTILIVEDNPAARLALETVLDALGYAVLAAADADQALRIFRLQPDQVDLVMTDLILPGMGGPELCLELRKQRPDLRCMVMSGYPLEEEQQRLIQLGIGEWIQKPFGLQEISARLRAIFDA